jgi:hypothetical protein
VGLLQGRRSMLETGARRLLEKETLTEADLQLLLGETEAAEVSAAPAGAQPVAPSPG